MFVILLFVFKDREILRKCLQEGEEGSKYCFAAGDLRVECQDDSVSVSHYHFSTTSALVSLVSPVSLKRFVIISWRPEG